MGLISKSLETFLREKEEKVRNKAGTVCPKSWRACVISEQMMVVVYQMARVGELHSGSPVRDRGDCQYCGHRSVWTFLLTSFNIALDSCDSKSLWLSGEKWSPADVEVWLFSCSFSFKWVLKNQEVEEGSWALWRISWTVREVELNMAHKEVLWSKGQDL